MNKHLRLAQKKLEEAKRLSIGLFLRDRQAREIIALSLVSIAESLEIIADSDAIKPPACLT